MNYQTFNSLADFYYNPDSTQREIVYSSPTGPDTVRFGYGGNKLIRIKSTRSARTSEFYYNASNQIASMIMKSAHTNSYHTFEYSYKTNGKVAELKLFLTNEAGPKLQWTSVYEYDAQGLLSKVTATDHNNNRIIYEIAAYAEPCYFNPWSFINLTSLLPLYDIYNWPVLSTMDRLPKKIIKYTGNGTPVAESIQLTQFTIQGKQLDKTVSSLEIAGGPQQPDSEVYFIY
ncbi:hypothetical protein HB364_02860 [Pseudoflavitalea sp. X16]|uniref:hypothetical protein n=1 Tax=Paraflavitalea devenefica TaxID=2716334 RepID=UPI00141FE62E|nr:hypothetical protein [Paraflavitalea devenefica]NII24005.1 hypothetical protein [Paraflavitalea devenefica]